MPLPCPAYQRHPGRGGSSLLHQGTQRAINPVKHLHAHGIARFYRGAAEVGEQDDVLQGQQAGVHAGFAVVNVQAGGGDLAGLEGGDQGDVVHQGAAAGVGDDGAVGELGDAGGIEPVPGCRAAGGVEGEDVAEGEEGVVGGVEGCAGLLVGGELGAVAVVDGHAEGLGHAG